MIYIILILIALLPFVYTRGFTRGIRYGVYEEFHRHYYVSNGLPMKKDGSMVIDEEMGR